MKRSLLFCTIIALALMIPNLSSAALIDGIATDGAGTRVGDWYDGVNYKWVKYYIPLRSDTSGFYGIDNGGDTGTTPDSVRAQNLGGSLSMYIEFKPPFDNPALTASVDFWFKDLDLTPDNDPGRFMETVQFSVWNGSDYQPITRKISNENDDQWNSRFSITGDNDLRKISFNDTSYYRS